MLVYDRSEMGYRNHKIVPEIASSKEHKKIWSTNRPPPCEIVEGENRENDKQDLHVEQAKKRLEEKRPWRKGNLGRRKHILIFEGNSAAAVGPRGISRKLS